MCDFSERDYCFYGLNPYWLGWLSANYSWVRQLNLFEYYENLTRRNASYHFVVIALNSPFNHVKSNLAWSDATLAGSVVLTPDLPEYVRPGAMNYKSGDPIDFEEKFRALLSLSDEESTKLVETSYQWICDNILLSKLNQMRLEILKNI